MMQDKSLRLVDHGYESTLEEIRARYPEFENLPAELIPWPYRGVDWPMPVYCPLCSRLLRQFVWGDDSPGKTGYLEAVCFGRWTLVMPAWFTTKPLAHFKMTLGQVYRRSQRMDYDPTTGQPMDGPAHREQQEEKP